MASLHTELVRILTKVKCRMTREGAKHEWWFSPVSGRHFPVLRSIKSVHANEALKQAGLPKAF